MFAKGFFGDATLKWHVMDVGANIAAASLFLLENIRGRVRRMDIFEPEDRNMELARRNLRGRTSGHGVVFHKVAGVGNEPVRDGEAASSIVQSDYNKYRHSLSKFEVFKDVCHSRVPAVRFAECLSSVDEPTLYLQLD